MFGGLGGLGGSGGGDDWNRSLMGLAILSDSLTPRTANNPQDLSKTLAPLIAMNQKSGEERAVAQALVAAGIPPDQALQMAKSPAASGIMMKLREQQRQDSIIKGASDDFGRMFNGGSPSAPSGPAVPSMGGRRSDLGQPNDVENKFISTVKSEGVTNPNALAAIGAYGKAESGWSPNKVMASWSDPSERGEAGTSGGVLSWRGDRFNAMRNFVAQEGGDPVVAQAKFFTQENPALIQKLNTARSPDEAHALMADAWKFAGYNRQGGEYQRRLDLTQSYLPRFAGAQVASADPGFAPSGDMPLPRRPLVDGQMQQGGSPVSQAAPQAPPVANLDAGREGMRPGPGQGVDALWRNAEATPEQFDAQLARARGDAAAPQAPPQAATQAPTAPPAPPLPIQRPPAPQQPTPPPGAAQGQPQGMPSIDPNSRDGGAQVFAASGMGRGGPYLTPPKPMALPGAPATPAPVTAPVPTAPAGPQNAGGTQVAQGPSQTATDAVPAPPQQIMAQAQTLVQQDQAKLQAGNLGPAEAQRKAAALVQLGLQYERAGVKIADNLKPFVEFYLDQAKPTEAVKAATALGLQNNTPEYKTFLRQYYDKRPSAIAEAEFYRDADPKTKEAFREVKRPLVNIDQKAETSYDSKMGGQFADMNKDIIEASRNATSKIGTLNRLESLLNDPRTYTGAGAEVVTQVKRYAKALGMDVEGLEGAEALKAVSNQFALELRSPSGGAGMPGALSDGDRKFLSQMAPGLETSKAGNLLIIDYNRRMAQRSIEVEQLRRDYVKTNGRLNEGFYQKLAEFSEKNPLFKEGDVKAAEGALSAPATPQAPQPTQTQSPKVFTKDQFDKLPSGTRFIDPKGQERIKP